MINFTPGPWRYNDRLGLVTETDEKLSLIATCEPAGTMRAVNNSRLIAAAPEMLEALHGACQYCAMCNYKVCEKCKIHLILKKLEVL